METPKIRVIVAGAKGKMGQEAVQALQADERFEVVGLLIRKAHLTEQIPINNHTSIGISDSAEQLLIETNPDVWLDLTDASSVIQHIDRAIEFGVRPVIGATGYSKEDILLWDKACRARHIGGIACPNFAIGALLMIRFAEEAAKYFAHTEIIELHHDGKKDAPSGTAIRTAQTMSQVQQNAVSATGQAQTGQVSTKNMNEMLPARGQSIAGIPIHSVRLPGLVAHQEVLFGGIGETLTIRHDSLSRQSFMPGILTACAKVHELSGMIYGLENLLW